MMNAFVNKGFALNCLKRYEFAIDKLFLISVNQYLKI